MRAIFLSSVWMISLLLPGAGAHASNYGNSVVCGGNAVNNPSVDAGAAINDCIRSFTNAPGFSSAGGTIYLPVGNYYLSSPVFFKNVSNLGIRTEGFNNPSATNNAQACIAGKCAQLIANPDFDVPHGNSDYSGALFEAAGLSNLDLDHIIIDGNRANRSPASYLYNQCAAQAPQRGFNVDITFSHHINVTGVVSQNALCGTAFSFNNSIFGTFLYDVFQNNGRSNNGFFFSDGLTDSLSDGLVVKYSQFINNSDVALVVGNLTSLGNPPPQVKYNQFLQNALVEGKYYPQVENAAILANNWNPQGGAVNDLGGAQIESNSINCSDGSVGGRFCIAGIIAGARFWDSSLSQVVNLTVAYNTINAAWQGILIDGAGSPAKPVSISCNAVSNWVDVGSLPFSGFDIESNSTVIAEDNFPAPVHHAMSHFLINSFSGWFSTPGLSYHPPSPVLPPACSGFRTTLHPVVNKRMWLSSLAQANRAPVRNMAAKFPAVSGLHRGPKLRALCSPQTGQSPSAGCRSVPTRR